MGQWWRSVGWPFLVNHGNLQPSSFSPTTRASGLTRKIISALKMSPCGATKKLGWLEWGSGNPLIKEKLDNTLACMFFMACHLHQELNTGSNLRNLIALLGMILSTHPLMLMLREDTSTWNSSISVLIHWLIHHQEIQIQTGKSIPLSSGRIIRPKLWITNQSVSVDAMTVRFKVKHQDKRRITYKAKGDGFQAGDFCDAGYTYQVYLRNELAPSKYL